MSELKYTSRKVAEVTGKIHKNVIRDIEKLLNNQEVSGLTFEPGSYADKQGQLRTEYLMGENDLYLLITGYKPELRQKVINSWLAYKNGDIKEGDKLAAEAEALADVRQFMREDWVTFQEAVDANINSLQLNARFAYASLANLVCKAVTGVSATQYKKEFGPVRDSMLENHDPRLHKLNSMTGQMIGLVKAGLNYEQIKEVMQK
jgi:Rha family phage regulatory protein